MQISMNKETIDKTNNPHKALEMLRADLKSEIEKLNHKYEWYIITATNEDGGLMLTAEFSEERKKHFEANPL